jgi:hypothetical protein
MSSLLAGLALALLASLLLNGSYLLQHAGAGGAPEVTPLHPLRSFAGLLCSPLWSCGLVVGLLGWAVHVGALANAPLSLVQAFGAGGLALAVPAATWLLHERLSPRELSAVALMVCALVALAVGAHAGPLGGAVPVAGLLACLGLAGAAAALLALRRAAGPQALGAAAGLLYGAADAATKAATAAGHAHGAAGALTTPWPLLVVVLSSGAFFCFQRGLQRGLAVPVVALMTVMTQASATAAGLAVFGDTLGRSAPAAALHALAFAAIGFAAWQLAPAQARLAVGPDGGAAPERLSAGSDAASAVRPGDPPLAAV